MGLTAAVVAEPPNRWIVVSSQPILLGFGAKLDGQLQGMLNAFSEPPDDARVMVQMTARNILETRFEDEKVQVSESKRLLSLLETQRKKLLSRNLSGAVSDELYDQQQAEFDE